MDDHEMQQFLQQLSSSYGQIESMLGTEGYRALIEERKAERLLYLARADQISSHASAVRIFMLLSILLAMPVLVYLWKWAI